MKTISPLLASLCLAVPLYAKPLKVFILAGQSNMQGHAKIETFDYIGDDPATAPLLKKMRGPNGQSWVCDHVWISYLTQQGNGNGEVDGKLTAGFGARGNASNDDGKIGPEFTFGVMGVDGNQAKEDTRQFREAMAAPAQMPEFAGNVAAVRTADFWDEKLGAIQAKREKVRQMAYLLRVKDKNAPNKDGAMSEAQQREYRVKYEAELITPAEAELLKRGASNAGYHYLGCAKTFARMGQAFAEATLQMQPTSAR